MKLALAVLLAATAFAQSKSAQADLCVPPPSGTAPSLPAHLMTGQGVVHMQITTSNPEAQKFFDQGVAQMHSFWAVESERSFLQAAALDPSAPMPWWGVAMVASGDYRPRFQIDGAIERSEGNPGPAAKRTVEAAKKALELSQVPGKATDVEKAYIAAVVGRRLSTKDRDEAYIGGLRAIIAQYPKEVEAKTYLALHLMRGYELPSHTPRGTTMESVSILKALLIEAPDHPGVHHYVIHGYEGSTFAKDAWPSCKRYAELVPNIPHALHMPGHIYSTTGKFAEAEKSFSDAAVNELGYIKADALYGTGHHGHNVNYLATAYAFDGKYDQAKKAARSLLEFKENPREVAMPDTNTTAYRQGWFALMRAMVLAQSWDEILDGTSLPVYDKPREQAWRHWAMGVAQSYKGNGTAAAEEGRQMDAAFKQYEAAMKRKAPPELWAAREELTGHILIAQGKVKEGLNALGVASNTQRHLRYSEPPYYPRPVNEALGEIALKNGNVAVASTAFRTTLEDLPNSARSLAGLRETQKRDGTKATGAGGF